MSTLHLIEEWHAAARPHPTDTDRSTQLGCHFEEVAEMLDALVGTNEYTRILIERAKTSLELLSEALKHGQANVMVGDMVGLADSIADQVVTGLGVAHTYGINAPMACLRVNESNWSKFVDGRPLYNAQGKVVKGPNYQAPDLSHCVPRG